MDELKYEFPAINVKFIGEALLEANTPIYDLGMTLLSIQKLIHKGYLASMGEFEKGKKLTRSTRENLSLQIGSHQKGSDFYGLIPFLSAPENHDNLKTALEFVFWGIKLYASKRIKKYFSDDTNENRKQFVCYIYGDVMNLVNRIGPGGGTESIQITVPAYSDVPVVIDDTVRDYVREIGTNIILGSITTIRGPVQKMYTASKIVTIFLEDGRKCSIFMTQEQFNSVRYDQADRPILVVTGRPRYRLDQEDFYEEFEASSVSFAGDDSN